MGVSAIDWERHAACKHEDPWLFFGPTHNEPRRERERREAVAKSICARCPVLAPCRERALTDGEQYGVWGGLGEFERRAILARIAVTAGPRAG